ncbi:MAG: polyphosphate polymerase domain-containing protein [Vicinamibacterales bacterium]
MFVDSREARPFAYELKFLLPPSAADDVRAWARTHLVADPHGAGPHGDEYRTTTVYFDTPGFDTYEGHGSYGRAKYRVRRYDEAGTVFLERKLRRPGLLVKRRTAVAFEALDELARDALGPAGPGQALAGQAPPGHAGEGRVGSGRDGREHGWAGHWFARRIRARGMSPVVRISYHRMARSFPANGSGVARLTLDADLRAVAVDTLAFAGEPGAKVLEALVLELKYRDHVPALFRRLVEDVGLAPVKMSKYRVSVDALRLAESVVPARGLPAPLSSMGDER